MVRCSRNDPNAKEHAVNARDRAVNQALDIFPCAIRRDTARRLQVETVVTDTLLPIGDPCPRHHEALSAVSAINMSKACSVLIYVIRTVRKQVYDDIGHQIMQRSRLRVSRGAEPVAGEEALPW